jgi:hypothetical protein
MIGTNAFGINIQGMFPLPFPPAFDELVHVALARKQELQEADPFIQ